MTLDGEGCPLRPESAFVGLKDNLLFRFVAVGTKAVCEVFDRLPNFHRLLLLLFSAGRLLLA